MVFSQFVGPQRRVLRYSRAASAAAELIWAALSAARSGERSLSGTWRCGIGQFCSGTQQERRCLTPRSSRAPTAGHQARATGTVYIFCGPGLASRRRCRLTSNVRHHKRAISTVLRFRRIVVKCSQSSKVLSFRDFGPATETRTSAPNSHRSSHLIQMPGQSSVAPVASAKCAGRERELASPAA